MKLKPSNHRRRGFAAIMSITLIILVGAALVVLSSGVVADVKKTRNDAVTAQLRQLLTAGTVAAREAVSAADVKPMSIPMPPDLTIEGASLKLTPKKEGGHAKVAVEADFAGRRAGQTLTFTRDGDRWKLTDAQLD